MKEFGKRGDTLNARFGSDFLAQVVADICPEICNRVLRHVVGREQPGYHRGLQIEAFHLSERQGRHREAPCPPPQ